MIALVGGTVVDLDPPRVERADVVVEGDRIVQVGGAVPPHATLVDAHGCLVMPAFVVGHTHLYSALACGMPPPGVAPTTFSEILERVWWRLDKCLDDEMVEVSALVGAVEAARRGCACVIDHHASPNAIDGSLDRIAAALGEVGIRGVLCYETSDRDGGPKRDAGLRENERFARAKPAQPGMMAAMIGAHAPFTLSDETLDAVRDAATRTGAPVHVHVAEDGTDGADAAKRGVALGERVRRMGAMRAGSLIGHAVHLDAATRTELASSGAWIATCARSNMNNAVGLAPAHGARIAIGTDGIGADVIAEAQAHFFRHAEARDGYAMDAVARVAGAQRLASLLLGGAERTPSVERGARADLVVLAYDPPTPLAPSNLAGHALFGWSSACVRDTMCGGRFVVRDRAVQTVDVPWLHARARAVAARLWTRMHERD